MTFGNNSIFPFNYCNNNDLIDINNNDTCLVNNIQTSNLPDHKITEQAIRVSNFEILKLLLMCQKILLCSLLKLI